MKKTFLKLAPYVIVFIVAFLLLCCWTVGGNTKSWASSQNRPEYTFPELTLSSPMSQTFFLDVDKFLNDSLAVKLPLVSGVNLAVLSTIGLPLNGPALAGSQVPVLFPANPLEIPLFLAGDFTLPCDANFDALHSSLEAFNKVAKSSSVSSKILVVPNKSTVEEHSLSNWQELLLKCSVQGRITLKEYAAQYPELVVVEPLNSSFTNEGGTYWNGDTHWKPKTAEVILPYLGAGEEPSNTNWQNLPFTKSQDLLALISIDQLQSVDSLNPLRSQFEVTNSTLKSGGMLSKVVNTSSSIEMQSGIVVFDSFIRDSDLIFKIASKYRTTYFLEWTDIAEIQNIEKTDEIVLETVERYAYSRLALLNNNALLNWFVKTE